MAWIDDRVWCHPKLTDVSNDAFATWVKAICYSTGFQTKGHLTAGQLRAIGTTPKAKQELVKAGLWVNGGESGAINVHDWDDHNSKRDARREADKARKRRSRDGLTEPEWKAARAAVYKRDGGVCCDCGAKDERWHADHVPNREQLRADGISLADINHIETRCRSCHSKRTNPPDGR